MNNIYCSACGAENVKEARFCSQCGKPIAKVATKKNASGSQEKAAKPETSNSMLYLAVTVIAALIIVFLIVNDNRQEYLDKLAKRGATQAPAVAKGQAPPAVMQKVLAAKAVLEKDPKNYEMNVELGNSYFDIGRFEQAIKYYSTAVSVKADNPSVLIDLGVSYYNIKDFDNAMKYMQKALEINPGHVQGLYNLGIVYFNMGDKNNALKTWEKLLQINPGSREAQTAKKFVEQIKSQQ